MESKIFSKNCEKNIVVLYHGNCPDGYASAFIVWYYLKLRGLTADYIPCYYSTKPLSNKYLDKLKSKNIVMCDFSYKYDQFMQIFDICSSIIILDHHKTAETELMRVSDNHKIFKMDKCGAIITWEYFFVETIPLFFKYIQDRDLWKKELPFSDEFSVALSIEPTEFTIWEKYLFDDEVEGLIELGKEYIKYNDYLMNEIMKTSYLKQYTIDDKLIVVACVNSPIMKSNLGNKLLDGADFSAIYNYSEQKEMTVVSLRSDDNKLDVSEIAMKNNGGGHRNASGCILEMFSDNIYGSDNIVMENNINSDKYEYDEKKCHKLIEHTIDNLVSRIGTKIYKMGNDLHVFAYINCSVLKKEIVEYAFIKYSYVDYVVVYHYDACKGKTEFYCKSRDNFDIDENISLDGFKTHLDYQLMNNNGIFNLLKYNVKNSFIAGKKTYNYVLFNEGPFSEELLEADYFKFIERKFIDCFFLIFQVETGMIDYKDNDAHKIYHYEMFYNKLQKTSSGHNTLQLAAYGEKSSICFKTSKNIDEIIQSAFENFNEVYDYESDDECDN